MNILDQIIRKKEKEVKKMRTMELPKHPLINEASFYQNVLKQQTMSIIAEFKRASPSKGAIRLDLDPAKQARQYEQMGASAISVLTDEPFFKGSMDDLQRVREAVQLPILCKDFMIDPIQIDFAKAKGASIILLIVAALSDEQLHALFHYAKEQGLEVLVEVHNEEELKRALKLDALIIGINNRDLKTFTVDLQTTARLAAKIDSDDVIIVSESGIQTKEHVEEVARAGARAILVGETFMRTDHLDESFASFQVPLPSSGGKQNVR